MTSLLEYYRDPIFSVLLLVCLILIAAIASFLAGSYKQRLLALKARDFISKLHKGSTLEQLSSDILAEFAHALLKSGNYLRAKEGYMELCSRGEYFHYELAVCNIRLGLFSQAIASCELALSTIARDEKSLKALIYASFKLGDLARASDAARALALLDSKQSAAMKFFAHQSTFCEHSGEHIEYECPCCKQIRSFYEPFCSGCFEYNQANIYIRKKYV